MQLFWRGFASHCRLETWILMSALTISVLLFAFGLIAQEVSEGELLTFDKSVMPALRNPANPSIPIGPPWLQEAARNITSLGSTTVLGIISLAVVGYLFLARIPAEAWLILGAVLGGIALNNLLKFASTLSAITYLTIGALLAQTHSSFTIRLYFMSLAAFLTVLVALTRIYLGVHFPTDVLGGWCIGAAWAMGCWALVAWLQNEDY